MCGAGQLLARVPAAARRVRRGHRAAGLRHADARADGYTDVGAHPPPDDVQDAVYSRTDLGAHFGKRLARSLHPAEPAADAPALVQTHGGAHPAADEPRAFINAVAHADGAEDVGKHRHWQISEAGWSRLYGRRIVVIRHRFGVFSAVVRCAVFRLSKS